MQIQFAFKSAGAKLPAGFGQPTTSGHGWAIFAKVDEAFAKAALVGANVRWLSKTNAIVTL